MPGDENRLPAEALFEDVLARYSGDPRVTGGTGFGSSPGRRVDARIFAMLVHGDLVVKLPARRVQDLVETGIAKAFDSGKGRPMREWAAISEHEEAAWPGLVAEAYEFVGSIRRNATS